MLRVHCMCTYILIIKSKVLKLLMYNFSCLILVITLSLSFLFLSLPPSLKSGADAVITFSQGEFSIDILDIVKWEVEGLVTVLIGGSNPRSFVLDCTTDQANSGNLVWTRVGSSTVPFDVQALGNGTRLDMASITYSHLGDYRCSNTVTGESRTINITIG